MNNEFILLRHAVRQARVCVINKLIKEAKLLRDRYGNPAQWEKCNKKADKLIAEVYALKTIKDDEISRFGILNEKGLIEILQDPSSSSSVRIMARVAYHKTLCRRLTQFKERFPDCKKHLTEKKKKAAKLKDKDAAKTKKSKENNSQSKGSKKQKVVLDKNNVEQHNSKDEEGCNSELSEVKSNSRKRKKALDGDSTSLEKQKLLKLEKDDGGSEATVANKQSSVIKPSGVTKEATVKRFVELLVEQEANQGAQTSVESQHPAGTATEQVKTVDDFFITTDGQNYQGNSASTSCTKPRRYDTRGKTFQFNDRTKKQNANRKNDTNVNNKHPGKQSFSAKSKKMTPNKFNKSASKSNANANAVVNKKDDTAGLHPSWMAKKKEQEIMSKGFQGKRIVFTDD